MVFESSKPHYDSTLKFIFFKTPILHRIPFWGIFGYEILGQAEFNHTAFKYTYIGDTSSPFDESGGFTRCANSWVNQRK
jgi:hypothetical protein